MFRRGAMAGAKIEGVVGIDAVRDGGEVSLLGDGVDNVEEFVFAEVAAVGGVRAIFGIFHFVRFDEFVADAEAANELFDDVAIMGGIAGGKSGERKSLIAFRAMRGPGQVGGVRAS